jgi:hypothetical protein
MKQPYWINKNGITRTVVFIGGYAIKLPCLRYGWRIFLCGLLANMQEVEWSRTKWPELCPVLWSLPYGLLLVMPKVRVMTGAEFHGFNSRAWAARPGYKVPVEHKADSFGYLSGKIVALDYGGFCSINIDLVRHERGNDGPEHRCSIDHPPCPACELLEEREYELEAGL